MLLADETSLLELDLLTEAVFRKYGYDLRNFERASLERRLGALCKRERVKNLSLLQAKLLHDKRSLPRLLSALTKESGDLFRGPAFFAAFRKEIVPLLRTYPSVRIWTPGCGNGTDAMALAILLDEEGLGDKVRIYATDLAEAIIDEAARTRIASSVLTGAAKRWRETGAKTQLKKYFTVENGTLKLRSQVAKRLFFAVHNLATDASFNEFNVVVARDVLAHFKPQLQNKAQAVFSESLSRFGILALGEGETLAHTASRWKFEAFEGAVGFYRKVSS